MRDLLLARVLLVRGGCFTLAAPVSVAIAKRLIWQNLMPDIASTTRREGPLFAWAGQQLDAREGIESFLEHRSPQWKLDPNVDFPEWPTG